MDCSEASRKEQGPCGRGVGNLTEASSEQQNRALAWPEPSFKRTLWPRRADRKQRSTVAVGGQETEEEGPSRGGQEAVS